MLAAHEDGGDEVVNVVDASRGSLVLPRLPADDWWWRLGVAVSDEDAAVVAAGFVATLLLPGADTRSTIQ